jgi:beta-galactosidase/beta-glucuronidase
LHGPWEIRLIEGDAISEPSQLLLHDLHRATIAMPDEWEQWSRSLDNLHSAPHAFVELSRRFGLPTGLSDEQEVWLVIEMHNGLAEVWLNGSRLGDLNPSEIKFRFAIRNTLLARNRLQLLIAASELVSQTTFHSVQLEIGVPI